MAGLYYEEFEIGMEFNHALTRTVTETDNLMFCAMTHNPQPLHLDEEFSKGTEFGQRIVNSLFTLGLVIGVSVDDTTLGTTFGNLGMNEVRFKNPVFHGDTLRSVTRVKEMRESKASNWGFAVTMLMLPTVELRPNRVPWGPRRTSTRSLSNMSARAPCIRGE